ncbi:MAG: phosphohistidine phosphatase [Gaiellales bacterium]|nr:phosphohistidine phosphatase [Gaiellales bacterium]
MRTLHILRHAKSSWGDETLTDHARPLSPRGIRDAKRIAKHLGTLGAPLDAVFCSSAVRTRQTLDLIESSIGDASVEVEEGLYGASVDVLLERVHGIPDSVHSALVIGHNPGLEELVLLLAAPGPLLSEVIAKFPTGALATLALGDRTWSSVSKGDGELVGFSIPKDLS